MKSIKDVLEAKPPGTLVTIASDATVYAALEVLAKHGYGALPVVDAGRVVGIFSERDYAKKVELQGKASRTCKVSEVMTPNPVCIGLQDSLESCMRIMIERGFRHLPVVDAGRIVHMVSMRDAVRMLNIDREALLETMAELGSQGHQDRERSIQRVAATVKAGLEPLQKEVDRLAAQSGADIRPAIQDLSVAVRKMAALFDSIDRDKSGNRLKSSKVLLATDNRAEELFARMALGGTGVELETVSTMDAGAELLKQRAFDIICVNSAMIGLAELALKANPSAKAVFMTSESAENYVSRIRQHPYISNVVSQSETDRVFTVRSILTTVSKIVNQDYFGLEKYLNWGSEVREHRVSSSADRGKLCGEMAEFLRGLGIRRTLIERCVNIAEELLMNAIYDAPVDASGKRLYNHLERTVEVALKPHEEAEFRYGSDGSFLAISVRDPFGSIERETILNYLAACFGGKESDLHVHKSGGGMGLFIIFRSAHLMVFNVKKGQATEVIALLDLDPKPVAGMQKSSFHYFNA